MIYNHFTADGKTTLCRCQLAPRNFPRFTTTNYHLVTCRNCKPLAAPYVAFATPAGSLEGLRRIHALALMK